MFIKAELSPDYDSDFNNSRISLTEDADLIDVQLLELPTDAFLMAAFNVKGIRKKHNLGIDLKISNYI